MSKTHLFAGASLLALALPASAQLAALPQDLTQLSLEDLLNIQVTSVSRVAEDLSSAAAAIQVLTAADIQASAARNLPEALNLLSGITVAQLSGRSWGVASRGFNASTSDKLEVRLDGRSLYTPLFSGVIWELQDIPLERIERIEVIRGPGASLWGTNAVNGVINIVTKPAEQVRQLGLGSGNQLRHQLRLRQGDNFGELGQWELYLQDRKVGALDRGTPTSWDDTLEVSSVGIRGDVRLSPRDELLISLNAQDGEFGSATALPGEKEQMRGVDLITRWTRTLNNGGDLQLQLNIDESWRHNPGYFGENRRQFDADFRHHWVLGNHDLVWGAGVRSSHDHIDNGPTIVFDPQDTRLETYNLFIQDRISLSDTVSLTLGTKLEDNEYTGLEIQPTARIAWRLSPTETLWAAVSRAARSPNRIDRDLGSVVPGGGGIQTNDEFRSETAQFAELGWRARLGSKLTIDIATWYADYDRLRGVSVLPNSTGIVVANNGRGHSYGGEMDLVWAPLQSLRVWLGYAWLQLDYAAIPGSNDINIDSNNERDPEHQIKLRSVWSVNDRLQVFGQYRHVSELADTQTPSYNELDLNLQYQLQPGLNLELGGRNLLHSNHAEFNDGSGALIPREWTVGLHWDL